MTRNRFPRARAGHKAVGTTATACTTTRFFSPCGGASASQSEVGGLPREAAEVVCSQGAAALAATVASVLLLSRSVQPLLRHLRWLGVLMPLASGEAASVG